MVMGKIYVSIREPDDCSIANVDGIAWARPCSDLSVNPKIYQTNLKNGTGQIEVPPGCYIVDATWRPGCCGQVKETVVIFDCGEPICANLIREYAGEPVSRLPSLVNHAREADIEEDKITEMISLIEKIAGTVPVEKIRRFSKKEFEIKRGVSDDAHLRTLDQLKSIIIKK